jgi:hypothetical protein
VLILRLCDILVLGLLGIDFEMVKDARLLKLQLNKLFSMNWLRLLKLRDSEV